jgi:cell division protein FtsB
LGFETVTERLEQLREWFQDRQKRLMSIGICLLAAFVAYHVVTANNGIKVYFHKRAENRALQTEVERLKSENENLTKRVSSLKSDPQTIEKVAREEFKYTRPGEVVYMTQDPQQNQQPQPPANATAQKK